MEKYEISDPIGKIWNCNVYCWWNHRNFRGDFINLMIFTFIEKIIIGKFTQRKFFKGSELRISGRLIIS